MLKKMLRRLIIKLLEEKVTYNFKNRGDNVEISPNCIFSEQSEIEIGNHVYIGGDCIFQGGGGIKIGDGTIIAHRVEVLTQNHNYDKYDLKSIPYDGTYIAKSVIIEENVWIGSNVCILPGVTIGEGVVIGCGSVIVKDIPPFAIVGGNPAKILKFRDKEKYIKLKKEKQIYLKLKKENKVQFKKIKC